MGRAAFISCPLLTLIRHLSPGRKLTVLGFLFRVLAGLRNLAGESHKRGIAFKEPYLIIPAAERLNPLPRLDRRVLCQAIVLVVTVV